MLWSVLAALGLVAACGWGGYLLGGTTDEAEADDRLAERISYLRGRSTEQANSAEIDLGEFNTTVYYPETDVALRLRFRLAGTVTPESEMVARVLSERRRHRLREAVLETLEKASVEELTDTHLVELRTRLLSDLNRLMERPVFKNLIFSDYSLLVQ